MERRGFLITSAIGCGLLLLLVVVAIPAVFFFSFRGVSFNEGIQLPGTGQDEDVVEAQQAIPTFTPAPAQADVVEAPEGSVQVGSNALTKLYNQLNPGVVSIVVNVQRGGMVGQGSGSGFLIDDQGHIVTNFHVVSGAQSVTVVFYDGTQAPAEIIGLDPDSDLAVVQVEAIPEGAVTLALGDSDQVQVGEWVVAIGNPFALNNTMTIGIISAVGRTIPAVDVPFEIPEAIQTDAAINPGNSGGPLINLRGDVIGVNAQIATEAGVRANAGVGFAIPANIVRLVVPVLIEEGEYAWPWLGIEGGPVGLLIAQANDLESQQGAYISNVVEGGPADEAGLQGSEETVEVDGLDIPVGGDVVVEADGQQITDFADLLDVIAFKNPGDEVTLSVIRDGQCCQEVTVTLEARPDFLGP